MVTTSIICVDSCIQLSGGGASLFIIASDTGMQLKLICRHPKVASHTNYKCYLNFSYQTPYIAVQADPFGHAVHVFDIII